MTLFLMGNLLCVTLSTDNHLVQPMVGFIYPQSIFYKVEEISQQLLDDFQLICTNAILAEQFFYESDYLREHCLTLNKAIEILCACNEDLYLNEEITHLIAKIKQIDGTYQELSNSLVRGDRGEYFDEIKVILNQAYNSLCSLLQTNYEVPSITPTKIDATI